MFPAFAIPWLGFLYIRQANISRTLSTEDPIVLFDFHCPQLLHGFQDNAECSGLLLTLIRGPWNILGRNLWYRLASKIQFDSQVFEAWREIRVRVIYTNPVRTSQGTLRLHNKEQLINTRYRINRCLLYHTRQNQSLFIVSYETYTCIVGKNAVL
jgi:hypothetical protein